MRNLILPILFFSQQLLSQSNTEVYVMDIKPNDSIKLSNVQNISNNKGYDSQPFFINNTDVTYAGSVNGQTEIITIENGIKSVFNHSTSGGEFSPQPIPGTTALSAVRLDTTGYQRLYRYDSHTATPEELVKDAVIAYYTWADKNTIVAANIVDSNLHLAIHNIKQKTTEDLKIKVGRSFHNIPQSKLVSFIDKSEKKWSLSAIDPNTKEIKVITSLPPSSEDICWLSEHSFLLTKDNVISKYDTQSSSWEVFHTFKDDNLSSLSRIATSPDHSKLAVVSEVSPARIVQ